MTRCANPFLTQRRTALFRFLLVGVVALMELSAVASQSVVLTWSPSIDTNVAGYKIYFGVASQTYTNSVAVGDVTNTTITGLADNTTYFFAATTYDSTGAESGFSNEASYQTGGTNVNVVSTNSAPATNTPPALNALGNLQINENAGTQVVNLSGIGLGTGNQLAVTAVSSNPALIPNPAVNYTSPNATGTLTFAPAVNANGTATITVTANNGQAQSNVVTRTFTVTVNAVNQPPTLNALGNLKINENAGTQAVNLSGISLGTGNQLAVTAVSSNPALIPNPAVNYTSPNATGTLTFAPAVNGNGTATITVTANNGQAQSNVVTRTFTVTVNAVNQPPTLNPLNNINLVMNSGSQTVALSGITSGAANENQTLKVTAVSSTQTLIPNPTINYTSPNSSGTLTFKSAVNAAGTATITVTVNDGGKSNNIVTQTFTVTIVKTASVAKPVIMNQLTNHVAVSGQATTFAVTVAGTAPFKYQWKFNGANLPAATNSALTVSSVSTAKAGTYYVTVSNSAGSTNSAIAALIVYPTAAATLTSAASAAGQFTFTCSGVPGYQYIVQASSDLVNWTSVQTNTAPFTFTDTNAGQFNQRFYRTACLLQ
jgi:hypothetical protein